MPMERDEFTPRGRIVLAQRVNYLCSNPACREFTSGPHSADNKPLILGVAAHIHGAAPGGPRFDAAQSSGERGGIGRHRGEIDVRSAGQCDRPVRHGTFRIEFCRGPERTDGRAVIVPVQEGDALIEITPGFRRIRGDFHAVAAETFIERLRCAECAASRERDPRSGGDAQQPAFQWRCDSTGMSAS